MHVWLFLLIPDRFLAGSLVFLENHEQFPSVAEKVKVNFGFMFTAFGKAAFILSYVISSLRHVAIHCLLALRD